MNTDITDKPSNTTPVHGWVAYDSDCPFCRAVVDRWGPLFQKRGFRFVPLQDSWVQDRLGWAPSGVPEEFKLITPNNAVFGGADAMRQMARTVWWMAPWAALTGLPGLSRLSRIAYQWISSHRLCLGDVCSAIPRTGPHHHGVTTFFESP